MSVMMPKMMSISPGMPSPAVTKPPESLPLRSIPGSYGWPVLGPISDRLDYFWFQGTEDFFRKRIEKNKSTVFRTNVPPTFPFFTGVNPNVVAVLDCKSFAHLFDMEVVEKKNVLVGDFMPSVRYTGDIRVCAYLDASEPQHSQVKSFAMDILKRSSTIWVPTLSSKLDTMWDSIESKLSQSGSASYLVPLQQFVFCFLSRCLIGADTEASPEIAKSGYAMLDLWLALQLLPTVNIGFAQPLEEIFLHSFPYPFALVSGGYNKVAKFVEEEGKEVIERGVAEFKLSRQEAIHNLLFLLGFNAYGGFSVFFPTLLGKLAGDDGAAIQVKLREEVRANTGSTLSFDSVKDLELVRSFVYETLRLSPPVPLQYGRARKDFLLSSHDSVYEIKKGELLCGYQPLAMRDPKVFADPEKFVLDRFTKDRGNELLSYLYWSNGPQTGSPSVSNKQCPAKDYVTLTACLLVAHLFRRYDSIKFGSSGSITAVERAK
ncbi:hypothetical protein U1Q18_024482 [Sarracenia purpurea var. burkii]